MTSVQRINCINGGRAKMLLIIEPWAEEYWIDAGMSAEVVGTGGTAGGYFEVEYSERGIVIYGWEGSGVSVLRG